ncbi:MAG: Deoxyribodipyrimidine photo-lyase [Actinomycetota bacterium]
MPQLPVPIFDDVAAWVEQHLGHLICDPGVAALPARRGGQRASGVALAALDVTRYAQQRIQVHPRASRGSSMLSPYIRHRLLTVAEVAEAVAGAPSADRRKFVDELC